MPLCWIGRTIKEKYTINLRVCVSNSTHYVIRTPTDSIDLKRRNRTIARMTEASKFMVCIREFQHIKCVCWLCVCVSTTCCFSFVLITKKLRRETAVHWIERSSEKNRNARIIIHWIVYVNSRRRRWEKKSPNETHEYFRRRCMAQRKIEFNTEEAINNGAARNKKQIQEEHNSGVTRPSAMNIHAQHMCTLCRKKNALLCT